MYSNIVATGAFAWAPSSGVPAGSGLDPGTSNADIVDDGLEEGSGDSEEDVNPNFQTDMARMVGEINMSTSSNTKSSGKRKGRDHADVRCRKKKTSGIGVQLMTSATFDLDISIRAPFCCALHTLSASVAAVYLTLAYSTTKILIGQMKSCLH
ncbi:hypothetical protein POTOM_003504 [Populus tomentosa]|uniref:Uncharacterized protein n=1 Tax=Populus tomentosa TaxID=118781 RepID=A0A8X8IYP2_POPTO|nr:hypothetical protein POTOM_003504 [Populus tomentosa]